MQPNTNKNSQTHPIQRRILFNLLFEKSLNFANLKPIEMENSQFMFHIKQLIEKGYVSKHGSTYKLTNSGKEFANTIDVFSLDIAMYPKTTTVICIRRPREVTESLEREYEYLIYKRLKNPFYGCYGFPTQKVLLGETIEETVIKGLKEETGLEHTSAPKLFAIRHYHVYSPEKELLEDKVMYAFLFDSTQGELVEHIEGEYFWVSEDKMKSTVVKPQEEFWELYEALKNFDGNVSFKEISVETSHF